MSVGQFEPQLRRQRNHFTGPSEPQQSLPVCCLTISMPMSVQYRCAPWAVSALVAKSSDLIGQLIWQLSWVWKCCEFVQWNYTVVVKDYIVHPFEKAFRYMIYQFTHGGRWYYRQRTSHAHMKVKVLLTHKRLFPIVVPRLAQTKQHIRTNRPIVIEDDDLGLLCSLSFLQSVSCRALLCTAECPGGQLSGC